MTPTWADMGYGVQQAVALASGLDPAQVVWKWQNYDAPALDYVTLAFTGEQRVGQDYLSQTFDASRPRGQEFQVVVKGVREVTLEVECFARSALPGVDPANGPEMPGLDGMGRASKISSSLLLPAVRDLFQRVGGVTPFDPQAIQNVPGVVAAGFRGRAVLPIRCYASAQAVAEYFAWIAAVNVSGTALRGDGTSKSFSVSALAGEPWRASTVYAAGAYASNGGKLYLCTTGGTSASSGGPTGTGTGIVDGSVRWSYEAG